MKIIADNILTKAVDRCDLCIVQQGKLALKPLVPRTVGKRIFHGSAYSLPHLCCRRLCKCHNQKPVNIDRMLVLCNLLYDPFHKNGCLSGACCRRHENIAVP